MYYIQKFHFLGLPLKENQLEGSGKPVKAIMRLNNKHLFNKNRWYHEYNPFRPIYFKSIGEMDIFGCVDEYTDNL